MYNGKNHSLKILTNSLCLPKDSGTRSKSASECSAEYRCIVTANIVDDDDDSEPAVPPPVFLSYQWAHQPHVKLLKQHLGTAGYLCWMDVGQMGGGDKLFAKIDSGIRAAKVVVCCVTEKYAESPNCNREVTVLALSLLYVELKSRFIFL